VGVTKENLWDTLKGDYLQRFKGKLVATTEERKLVESVDNEPEIMRAAWNYYLGDESDHRFGLSVERFVKHINKYIAMISKRPGSKDGPVQHNEPPRQYKCENFDLKKTPEDFCDNTFWGMVREGDTYPRIWEDPCHKCMGRMVLVDAQEAKNE
jgi:hypothetical protein